MLQQIKQIASNIQDITQEATDLQKIIKINLQSIRIITNQTKIKQSIDNILQKDQLLKSIQTVLCDIATLQWQLQITQYIINQQKIKAIVHLQEQQSKICQKLQNIYESQSNSLKLSKHNQMINFKKNIQSADFLFQEKQKFHHNSINQYESINYFMAQSIDQIKNEKNRLEKAHRIIKNGIRGLTSITQKQTDYMKFLNGTNQFIDEIEYIQPGNISSLDFDNLQTPKTQLNIQLLKIYQTNMRLYNKLKKEKKISRQLQIQNQRLLKIYNNSKTKKINKNQNELESLDYQSELTTRSL